MAILLCNLELAVFEKFYFLYFAISDNFKWDDGTKATDCKEIGTLGD